LLFFLGHAPKYFPVILLFICISEDLTGGPFSDDLTAKVQVIFSTVASGSVFKNGLSKAGSFGHGNILADHGIEHPLAEALTDLVHDGVVQSFPAIVARGNHAIRWTILIEFFFDFLK